jgi:hypothetical protein
MRISIFIKLFFQKKYLTRWLFVLSVLQETKKGFTQTTGEEIK